MSIRLPKWAAALLTALTMTMTSAAAEPSVDDPYRWLEEVQGDRALTWVRERNAEARTRLEAWPHFVRTREQVLEVLDSRDKIPSVTRRGGHLYNLWQDASHPRGLWRRTTLAEYRKALPAWETLIDLDALGKTERENWVWGGAACFGPAYERCLVSLSRGGADARVVREFDIPSRRFVKGGFVLPEAKSSIDWVDRHTVLVATDFGPGSLTDSGYPRIVKRWKRGQALERARTLFEAKASDMGAFFSIDRTPGFERTQILRYIDFYRSEVALLQGDRLVPVAKPADATLAFWHRHVLIELRSDWSLDGTTWPKGSLLAADAARYLKGERHFEALFTPTPTRSLAGYTATRGTLLLSLLDNIAGRVEELRPQAGAAWVRREVDAPAPGTLGVQSLHDPLVKDDPLAEGYLLSYADFTTPDSLFLARTGSDERERLKVRPSFFDAVGVRAEQRFATSKDGTKVPYFVVWPKGAVADGTNPTLLYGYGGFEVSLQPAYSGAIGRAWYERGGVFVQANIRGGGEFGPAWHQVALKANKQKSYDDYIAVAEDLVAQRITSPRHLGIEGGSNGGLLVGAVMLQRPELFGAVVCQVPLLDMRRYHLLLAGASWMAEYGDPEQADEWAYLSKYSPYQNVQPGVKLPPILFTTSTRDDRVHPGHARKMAARMREQGHEVVYYENIEGGHGGAADNAQRADMSALEFAFLWQQLGGRAAIPAKPSRDSAR
jgi:prolyl oligopeptidase